MVAAHPDDEILGCGAAMAKHAAQGDSVHVLILAEGITSRDGAQNQSGALSALAQDAQKANDILKVASLTLEKFPDNRMDSVALIEVVKAIEKKIAEVKPTTVYTHFCGDLNVDHRVTHQAVLTACRPLPGQSVKTILSFEVRSSTEWGLTPFVPNLYIDVSEHLSAKLKALACYESEMRPFPHSRSIEAIEHLARSRGAEAGVNAAEAFCVQRIVR